MDRNFERSLKLVLVHEGGYSDHPKDPGGATMKGVTLATYRRYVKKNATKADLRAISDADLGKVYYEQYWKTCGADRLPSGLDYATFDFAVNSGPGRAVKFLQGCVGVTQDGGFGGRTLAAVKAHNTKMTITALCQRRLNWLRGLRTFSTFGKGWTRRVQDVEKEALRMALLPSPAHNPVLTHKPAPAPVSGPNKGKATAAGGVAVIVSAAIAYFWDKIEAVIHWPWF